MLAHFSPPREFSTYMHLQYFLWVGAGMVFLQRNPYGGETGCPPLFHFYLCRNHQSTGTFPHGAWQFGGRVLQLEFYFSYLLLMIFHFSVAPGIVTASVVSFRILFIVYLDGKYCSKNSSTLKIFSEDCAK